MVVHLRWLLRRRIHAEVEVRDGVRRFGDHIDGRGRGEAAAPLPAAPAAPRTVGYRWCMPSP